jgi:hypothetical protein
MKKLLVSSIAALVAADDLGCNAMKLFELGEGVPGTPPSLFAYRQGPVTLTAPPR